MKQWKIEHFQCQSDSQKRLLDFIREENIHLKYLVTVLLRNGFKGKSLEEVEEYYNKFLKADQLIEVLRDEIIDFDGMLKKEQLLDGRPLSNLYKIFSQIKRNIESARKEFAKLKNQFNTYALEKLL